MVSRSWRGRRGLRGQTESRTASVVEGAEKLSFHGPRPRFRFRWTRLGGAIAGLLLLTNCAGPGGRLMRYPNNDGGGLSSPHDDRDAHHSGRYIALVSDRRGRQEIELFDTRSRRLIPLPGLNRQDSAVSHPSVSADGQFIAYASVRDGRSDIYLYRRSNRESRNLTGRLKTAVRNPSVSELSLIHI